MTDYNEALKDPRWQRKRLEVLNRDGWTCQVCGDTKNTLHVHHRFYTIFDEPWDCENENLITLCERCHQLEHLRIRPGAQPRLLEDILEWYVVLENPGPIPWHIEKLARYLTNPPYRDWRLIGIFPTDYEANSFCDDFEKQRIAKRRRIGKSA